MSDHRNDPATSRRAAEGPKGWPKVDASILPRSTIEIALNCAGFFVGLLVMTGDYVAAGKSLGAETGTGAETGRVDLGGRPPRSPTDPDLRVKCIPLVSLWACLTRSLACVAAGRFDALGVGPTSGRSSRPLLLRGRGYGSTRAPLRRIGVLLNSLPPVRRSSFPCLAIPSLVRGCPTTRNLAEDHPGARKWVSQPAIAMGQRLPRRRQPGNHSPCSSDPDVTRHAGGSRLLMPARPPRRPRRGLTTRRLSGINHSSVRSRVYASRRRSPAPTQDSLPGCWPAPAGRDWSPAGSLKGFTLRMILLSRASWRKVEN